MALALSINKAVVFVVVFISYSIAQVTYRIIIILLPTSNIFIPQTIEPTTNAPSTSAPVGTTPSGSTAPSTTNPVNSTPAVSTIPQSSAPTTNTSDLAASKGRHSFIVRDTY